jgi:Right handed beta helix region
VRAGTYRETVSPRHSGRTNAPITFSSYPGERPTVDGADPVAGWRDVSKAELELSGLLTPTLAAAAGDRQLWVASVYLDDPNVSNQLLVDGRMLAQARWPGSGSDLLHPNFAHAGPGTAPSLIVDPALAQPRDFWKGTIVHLWGGLAYMSQTGQVTNSQPGEIAFTGGATRCPYLCAQPGTRYYLTGTPSAMSEPGQWFAVPETDRLYLWSPTVDDPSRHQYELRRRNFGFDLSGRSNVTIRGFDLQAASVRTDASSADDVIDNLFARYVSDFNTIPVPDAASFRIRDPELLPAGIVASHLLDTGIILQGSRNALRDSIIEYSAGNGVSVQGDHNTVTGNLIRDTDYMGTYGAGIYVQGDYQVITHNTVLNSGRDGLTVISYYNGLQFANNSIAYNNILDAGLLNQDAAAIYVCCQIDGTGTSIDHNWTHDLQAKTGRGTSGFTGAGIYIDSESNHFLIHHNVSWDNAGVGLILNGFGQGLSQGNRVYNNTIGGGQVRSLVAGGVSDASDTRIVNNIFRGLVDKPSVGPGAYLAANLPYTVVPKFRNYLQSDWRLVPGSPGIAAGEPIPQITTGPHPDIGAYQSGQERWAAGCTFPGCTLLSIDEGSVGLNNAFQFSGANWQRCSRCDLSEVGIFDFAGTYSSDQVTGDAATFAFSGVGIILYALAGPDQGFASVSVDGGVEEKVDLYQEAEAGDVQVYSTPLLRPGRHTLTILVLGSHDASSGGSVVSLDRVDVLR